jgi:hypothetical protein
LLIAERRLLIVAAVTAVVAVGCGRQEQAVVNEFFSQSRLRDKTALQKIATVTFEPTVQGIVQTFEIVNVTEEENGAKAVTVTADVKLPDGRMVQKRIVLTMTKGLITGFLEAAAPPPSPRS